MPKNLIHIFLILIVILLAGCVSISSPLPEGYSGPKARVSDTFYAVSPTKIHFFQVAKVNERQIATSSMTTAEENRGRGLAMSPTLETRYIPAPESLLRIEGVTHVAADILAFGGGMYHVEGEVSVHLEPNREYFVRGVLGKGYSAVWIEDGRGQVVSEKIEKHK